MVPVLVTSLLTFDSRSDKLREGESAIVYSIEEESEDTWVWSMLSVDRPRVIVHRFHSKPARVFKSWLKPEA